MPLIKGDGIYKKIIGYVDYIITFIFQSCPNQNHNEYAECKNENTDICKGYYCFSKTHKFGIEVKTTKESLGEVLRQIKLYRTYHNFDCFYLIGDCMSEYKDILKDHKIYMIEEKKFKVEDKNG